MLDAFAGAFCEALVDGFAADLVGAFFVEAGALATAVAFVTAFPFSLLVDAVVVLDFGTDFFMLVGLASGSTSFDAAFFVAGCVDAFAAALAEALAGALVAAFLGVVAGFAVVAVLAMVFALPPPSAKGFIVVLCFADSLFTSTDSRSSTASPAKWISATSGEGL